MQTMWGLRSASQAELVNELLGASPLFLRCCALAELLPKRRQARKWLQGKGRARTFVHVAQGEQK